MSAVSGRVLMRRQTSYPERSSIFTSRRTTSGARCATFASASVPDRANSKSVELLGDVGGDLRLEGIVVDEEDERAGSAWAEHRNGLYPSRGRGVKEIAMGPVRAENPGP